MPPLMAATLPTPSSPAEELFESEVDSPLDQAPVEPEAATGAARLWRRPWALATAAVLVLAIVTGVLVATGRDAQPAPMAAATPDTAPATPAPGSPIPPIPTGQIEKGRAAAPPDRAGQAQADVSKPGVEANAATEPSDHGSLLVISALPLEIFLNGRRLGSTTEGHVPVPPGRQTVELVNSRFNYRDSATLNIEAGQVVSHSLTPPPGHLRVMSATGAEVWVEGEHVGVAPLDELTVPVGTHEVVVRHPQLGERRQLIDVVVGTTATATIPFDESARGAEPVGVTAGAPPMPRPAPLSMAPAPRGILR